MALDCKRLLINRADWFCTVLFSSEIQVWKKILCFCGSYQIQHFCHKRLELRQFCRENWWFTHFLIAFKDLLAPAIAPQAMPHWSLRVLVVQTLIWLAVALCHVSSITNRASCTDFLYDDSRQLEWHWSVSAPVWEGRAKSAAGRTQSEPVQKNTSFETARKEIPLSA